MKTQSSSEDMKGSIKTTTKKNGRLDRILQEINRAQGVVISRKKIKQWIDQGLVTVNGRKVIIASWEIRKGDQIQVLDPSQTELPSAEKFYLKIVFEDADILVVEKEAGVACEVSAQTIKPTMVAMVNAYFKRKFPHLKHHYVGLLHRLDQETSGLMVYSKTREGNKLAAQFKEHSIRRKYIAVVQGEVKGEEGKIEGYLKKNQLLKGGKKVAVATPEAGQYASTRYKVLERYRGATLVEVAPNTGRTHQIRVQMTSLGHPLLGDRIYGDKAKDPVPFSRHALHAAYLKFTHPLLGEKMEFSSSLPKDLRRLVERLRIRA